MPVQLTVKVDKSAELVRKGLQDLRAEVPKIGKATIYSRLDIAKRELNKPAKKITYPVNWDTQEQKIAYFNSGGFGKGIPYVPTGKSRGWALEAKTRGWKLINKFAAAVYLFGSNLGERQSSIHKGRRPVFRDVVEKHVSKLPKTIQDNITVYIKRKGL